MVACCAAFGCCSSVAQVTSPQPPAPKAGLRCYAMLDAAVISQTKDVHARVWVENNSPTRKAITRMTVYLENHLQSKFEL